MKFSLLPKGNVFFQLLERLSLKADESVQSFKELIGSWSLSHPALQDLRNLEHECDQIVHEIMVKVNKTFITPIDREDIHQLAKKIDDLVDIVQALSERMSLFQIDHVREDLKEMGEILEQAVKCVVLAIQKIRALKDTSGLFDLCVKIHTLENQGDRIFERALGELFQKEKEPIEIIKWKEIYDFLELAIDKCEDIADILWGIAVKYG